MFDNDQLTEPGELRELRDAFAGVALSGPPPLEAIKARGRAHRRRRRSGVTGLVASGAVACTALTLALVAGFDRAPAHSTTGTAASGPSRAATPGTIRTPSYTLVSDTTGTVKLTINPMKLFDADALQRDLARFGIPAKVTAGRFCSSDPAPAGLSQVVSMEAGPPQTITFDPAAIPAGAKLSFGTFPLTAGQVAAAALIDIGSFTCSTSAPINRPGDRRWVGYLLYP